MKILLDTCSFLWILTDDERLSPKAREVFLDKDNECYLSAVSAWEISLLHALGRLHLPQAPERFVPRQRELHGISELALEESAALQVYKLPPFHRDPFDRMLICQAVVGGLTILTPDEHISCYPVATFW